MKTGNNKWLIVLLATLLACCLVTGTLFACQKEDDPPTPPDPTPVVEGEEKGVYSLEEMTLTLNGTGSFTLSQDGNLSSGTYTAKDGVITLTFGKTEDGTATCTLHDSILVLTMGSAEYRLYKQVKLTVTLSVGTSTSEVKVTNGELVAKPTDPEKDGYRFIAWYKTADFSGKPFDFDTEVITENITLYAKMVEYIEGTTEYTVSFDLGYDTADTIASQRTLSGKLLDGAPAPTREGYTFKGWWISAYDQADKLTCQYVEGSAFTSDTTLFALWQADGTTLGTMDVTSTGVTWAGVTEAAKLTITKPDGTTLEQSFGATGASAYRYDLSAQTAGEYKFTLTYGNNTVERYYRNKALTRVSGFKVVGNSILLFDGVDKAEGYYLTVKCGNAEHNHTDVYIGKSTTYNFVNCAMRNGGIEFQVKAVAAGYLESVATFTFDRSLAAVTDIAYDATTGLLTWAAVENAQHYIVTVAGEEYYLGTETKLDIKSLPAGELNVTVKAVTEGFNSAPATSAKVNKTDVAAPTQLAVKQGFLTWSAVEGAKAYRVQINDTVVDVTEAQLALDAKYITIGNQYTIKVKAVFETSESLWSSEFILSSAKADSGLKNLSYTNGKFAWTAMSDADIYEYQVNDGVAATTTSSYAYVQLTKAGTNQLKVRYRTLTGDYSDWATFEVFAYSVTLDSMGGNGVETQYKAIGDTVELPTTERIGYDFAGWYNVAGGSASNGTQFTAKTFDNPANIVLYANWLPRSYVITLDYNEYGEGTVGTVNVTYTKHYTLPVPKMLTDDASAQMGFVGWYATPDGKGVQYTDELGNSLNPWNITDNTTLYAKYVEAFAFSPDGEGGYSVKAGKNLGYYTETITIPSSYKDLPVRSIAEYGFKGYSYLKYVNLPDTLESIPSTAFDGCSRIEAFHMTKTESSKGVFEEVDGAIVMTLYGQTTLHLIPSALTGTFRVPAGVTTIGSRTFNKAKFDTVVIPASVTNIEADAFVNCSSLKMVIFDETELKDESDNVLPKQLLTIDNAAFNDTLYVEKFILPARLAEITNVQQFFSQFKLLSSIEFTGEFENQVYSALTENDGGKNIAGMLANANKDEIIYCPISLSNAAEFEVEIPSSIIKIAAHAFDSFEESKTPALKKYNPVTKVTFNGNLAAIGDYAFYKSRNLTEVTFKAVADPVGMTIGDYAFYRCNKLNVVTFEEEGAWSTTDSNIFEATTSCGVKSIGAHAFDSASITELKLPYSLNTLGEYAFANATALKSIDLANVSPILTFGDYAFSMCRSLTAVELTKNVGTMNFNLVFYECTKLELTVSPDNPNYTVGEGGVLYNKDVTEIIYYPDSFEGVYELPESVTKISGAVFKGKNSMTSIVISKNVVEIGDSAFEDCANLKSVTFAADGTENLTIGKKAFLNCTSLKEIALPARTTSIGDSCFSYDTFTDASARALEKITLNEGLQTIGEKAFAHTSQLTSINIPSTVNSIGNNAFYFSALGSITFAASATELELGDSVFYACENLQSVVFPEGLVNIPARTFYNNSSLKSVTIPTTVRNLGDERAIGQFAFYGCANLSEVIFTKGGSESLSFAGGAFNGCDSLTKLSLPARIASLDTSKFDVFELGTNGSTDDGDFRMVNCNVYAWKNSFVSGASDISNLAEIEVEEGGTEYSSYKGVLYNADKSVLVWCPFGKVGEVEVAKETTKFRASAFNSCHYVTSVVFEKGGTAPFVMEDATTGSFSGSVVFFSCYNLKTIAFPSRLQSLGNYALYNETSMRATMADGTVLLPNGTPLTQVTFEEDCQLTSIGENAFENQDITEIELPKGVTTVGKFAFKNTSLTKITLSAKIDSTSFTNITTTATGLQSVIVPADSETLTSAYDGQIIYSKDMTKVLYVVNGFETDVYTVPATITEIAANTFKGREGIKSIAFAPAEDGATLEIGNYAFSGTGITSIELPARVTKLGTNVFRDCKSLTSVTFAEGYKYAAIPDYTFYGCSALESITIPGEVSSIGSGAFQNAGTNENGVVSGLKSITFALTAEGQQSVLSEIKNNAFNNCYALTTIRYALKKDENGDIVYAEGNTLPSSITKLGQLSATSFNGPFINCISLQQITLPADLTIIGKDMFSGCVNLKKVNLPSSMTTIRENAFANTAISGLDLSAYQDNSLTIYEGAFNGCANLASFDLSKVKLLCLNNTFANCTSLTSLEIGKNVQLKGKYKGGSSSFYNKAFTDSGLKKLTIDQNVLPSMFEGCESIENVILGSNVSQIGDSAFEKATGLKTVDVSAVSELALKADAFKGATSLKTIDLSKVKEIGKYAFQNCESLTNIGTINGSITSLLDYTFDGAGLTSFDLSATNVTTLGNYVFRNSKLTSVVVPETITSVGNGVFSGCVDLRTAQFLAPVVKMSSSMFSGCTSLTSVTIGDSVTELGDSALANTALTAVDLKNVNKLGQKVFENCTSLKSVTINAENIEVSSYGNTFMGVSGVQFVVPEGGKLTADGGILYAQVDVTDSDGKITGTVNKLLVNLDTRKDVVVKEGTQEIARNAFRYNTYVETVTLPESVTTIDGYYTFAACTNLKSINLDKITSFGSYTENPFQNTAITEVKISTTVNKLFRFAANLQKVTIVTDDEITIASEAFKGCTSLSEIAIEGDGKIVGLSDSSFSQTAFTSLDAFQDVKTIGRYAFEYSKLVTAVIPEGLTTLGNNCFQDCYNLVSVTVPASLTDFGSTPFARSNKIVEVINLGTLPITAGSSEYGGVALNALNVTFSEESGVDKVGDYTFYSDGVDNYLVGYLGSETQLTLPANYYGASYKICNYAFYKNETITSVVGNANVTGIGDYAFYGCEALASVSGFTAIKYIGDYAFYDCPISNITLPNTLEEIGDFAFRNCDDLVLTESNNLYYLGSSDNLYMVLLKPIDATAESYEINRATKYIASEAFSGCKALTSIAIPEGVKTIGAKAFYNCSALTSITVPSSVTSIGSDAFNGCDALTEVNLSEGLVTIGANAFKGCKALTNIVLPESATDLGESLFYNCSALTTVTLGSAITEIPAEMFYSCSDLTEIAIPAGVTSIGESAFNGCKALTSVVIPEGVTEVAERTFYNCTALTTVTLPKTITYIGDYAFYGCSELTSVGSLDNVTEIGARAFQSCAALTSVGSIANVESIGTYAFAGCTSIESLTITGKTTFIDAYAFQKWTANQTITFTEFTAAPSTWKSTWKSSCSAKLVWATAEESGE